MSEQTIKNMNNNNNLNIGTKKINRKSPENNQFTSNNNSNVITRERSFIRSNQQNINNKRRSMNFVTTPQNHQQQHQNQIRGKPAIEIYRPPNIRTDGNSLTNNKLNVNAQEFTLTNRNISSTTTSTTTTTTTTTQPSSNNNSILQNQIRSSVIFSSSGNPINISHSKSNASLQQMHNYAFITGALAGRYPISNPQQQQQQQQQQQHHHHPQTVTFSGTNNHRPILVSHPTMISMTVPTLQQTQIPIVNSPSSGNVLHNHHRVKFAADPQVTKITNSNNNFNQQYQKNNNTGYQHIINNGGNPLQRSKSLSSADTLTRGLANLGLGVEANDIGQFTPDIQNLIDRAIDDPNQLNARCLMDLALQVMNRAIEGRRYALPISRLCITIIAKESKETFLEALLNTCRQWYQEREKILYTIQGMKSPSRTRFTAFMAFLTEMYCQLRRRQLQLRTQYDGFPPPLVILILLAKCCEDCVKLPVRSLSEIECLFFVLTCIGKDLEQQLPHELESLLSSVRDAFLNSAASAPAIRRTLLQLIELQASRWQLPGNTVLYYYPSTK